MASCLAVADVLDKTINALAVLDSGELELLEKEAAALAQSNLAADEASMVSVLAKQHVLELVLQGSASNLNALNRLYGRNTRDPWEP